MSGTTPGPNDQPQRPQQGPTDPGQQPPPYVQQPGQAAPPPYVQQGPPPGYAQPGPAQPYPPQGPGYPAGGYPPGTPPEGGRNKSMWLVLGGIAAFVVLLLVVGIAVIALRSGGDEDAGTATASAGTQADVVREYLEAIADQDAEAALALSQTKPLSTEFLTDEMLEASAEVAPLTAIKVGDAENEYDSSIPATFKIGDQVVSEEFSVTKAGDGYRLRQAATELDLTSKRANTLPMLVNGKEVTTDKITLFPGAYEFSTGSDYIDYGAESTVYVKSNSDYTARVYSLEPTLTEAGNKAFAEAVRESAQACLKQRKLSPGNCPNQAGSAQNYRIDKETVRWRLRSGSSPFANLKPRLDYDNPTIATVRPSLSLEVRAECSAPSGKCSLNTYSSSEAQADMTKEPISVKWVD